MPWRLLAGPWSHKDPSNARPGPNIDCDREVMAFFDQHLRGGPPSASRRAQIFVRRPTPPQPDLAMHDGHVAADRRVAAGPSCDRSSRRDPRRRADGRRADVRGRRGHVRVELVRRWSAVGAAARSAHRQRALADLRLGAHRPRSMMLGQRRSSRMRVRSSADGRPRVGEAVRRRTRWHVDADHPRHARPDPSRVLAGRRDRRGRAAPAPLVPDEWMDVSIELEATTWTLLPGHRLRLAIAGTDWPNCWPPKSPFVLGVDRGSVRLELRGRRRPAARDARVRRRRRTRRQRADGVEWRYEHDVLAAARAGCTAATAARYEGDARHRSSTTATRARSASARSTCRSGGHGAGRGST